MTTKSKDARARLTCSFCGKSQTQVKKLIAGPGVYICDECIELCQLIIDEEINGEPSVLARPEVSVEDALVQMVGLHQSRDQVDREVAVAIRGLRSRGVTWTRIGEALGISKQSAWERYSGED